MMFLGYNYVPDQRLPLGYIYVTTSAGSYTPVHALILLRTGIQYTVYAENFLVCSVLFISWILIDARKLMFFQYT